MMRGCSAVRSASRAWGPSTSAAGRTLCPSCRNASKEALARQPLYTQGFTQSSRSLHTSPTLTASHLGSTATSPTLSSSTIARSHTSLPEQLRSVMRALTHPVVVCTAFDASTSTPRGMTMSSFTSLSLAPTPLVTFNVATPSRTLDAIRSGAFDGRRGGTFNIHVLSGDASGARVAENFTRGNAEGLFERLEGAKCILDGGGGAPRLDGEGVLCVLRCVLAADEAPGKGIVQVRDHVIVVGEVVEVVMGKGGEEAGLSYTDRSYRGVGAVVARH